MTKPNLYVDINVLQTVPSSNINRDDTGAPKTAMYGGVTRARVSSQSWKRAVREAFRDNEIVASHRTKEVPSLLATALKDQDSSLSDDDATQKAESIFDLAGINLKDGQTKALLFVSQGQIEKLAEYTTNNKDLFDKVMAGKKDKKVKDAKIDKEVTNAIKTVLETHQSLDLALFGRMVADNPELNVDGAAQVAHTISTHEIVPEYDYFTALDDEKPDDSQGAAMLGTVQYNSATLYRYANVNAQELAHNLGTKDAINGIREFIKYFVLTMPIGKEHSFANKTLPSYVMVTLRPDTPVNLVSAFEDPVTSNHGYVNKSVEQLELTNSSIAGMVDKPLLTVVFDRTSISNIDNKTQTLTDLLDQVGDNLKEVLPDENPND